MSIKLLKYCMMLYLEYRVLSKIFLPLKFMTDMKSFHNLK